MKTLWLIPARGGSKGIPNKNLRPFCGESLVRKAIKQALSCAAKDDVVFVSTDSDAIKEEAEKNGIEIPFLRPYELASDTASTYSVILHTLKEFKTVGRNFERVVLLQPTSPFRTTEDIKGAMELWSEDIDMVVSVSESKANPYFNLFEEDQNGFLNISKGEGKFVRRQDAPKVWEYNGAIYIMKTDSLIKESMHDFKRKIPYEMSQSKSLDLDTEDDWLIAEEIFKKIQK